MPSRTESTSGASYELVTSLPAAQKIMAAETPTMFLGDSESDASVDVGLDSTEESEGQDEYNVETILYEESSEDEYTGKRVKKYLGTSALHLVCISDNTNNISEMGRLPT